MAGTVLGARDIIVNQTETALPFSMGKRVGSEVRLLGFESWLNHLIPILLWHIFDLSKAQFLIHKMEITVALSSKKGENYMVEVIKKCFA